MKRYNILMINMSRHRDWMKNGVVNRNYHIFNAFKKDPRVKSILSVDFLPINWKRGLKYLIQNLLFHEDIIKKTPASILYQADDKTRVFSTINNLTNPRALLKELKELVLQMGDEELIIWNCNPLFTQYLDQFPHAVKIFDAVDNWSHHSAYQTKKDLIKGNYLKLTRQSDLVFTVSESLAEDLPSDHTFWLPNAVDFNHFNTAMVSKRISNLPKPRIGFLGILQDRIDVELIKKIAQEFSEASIILAGPEWKNFPGKELKNIKNIYFTGSVSYQEIPNFYAGFDVGIIPYAPSDFIKSTNSMKFYEYLAAGIPVVSTVSGGVEDFSSIIKIAQTHPEFINGIREALREDSEARRIERQNFIKSQSWAARINQVFQKIEKEKIA